MSRALQDRGPNERLISFPTMLELRFYQKKNSPYNVGHIGSLLENISNFSLFPTIVATNYRYISANFKSTILLPTMLSIFFDCFYESSLQVFRFMALFQKAVVTLFQKAVVLVCEIYRIEFTANASVVELFSVEP